MSGTSETNNSWNLGVALTDAQFRNVATSGWDGPRQADGSLPEMSSLHLATTSALIDKGIDIGQPYAGRSPDLGAFETSLPPAAHP